MVDDAPENLALVTALLGETYDTLVATTGEKAREIARRHSAQPDLILLDIQMPGIDGFETCRLLKHDPATCDIPIIFLTSRSSIEDESKGFSLGAVDYITKPISPPKLLARVRTHLRLRRANELLDRQNRFLEDTISQRTEELALMQDATGLALASLAEARDQETGNHIRRTQHYVAALAKSLRSSPRLAQYLDERSIDLLYRAAALHDIGKVAIPDRILLKKGKLSENEFEIMKLHTVHGRDAIANVEKLLGKSNAFLRYAREIAYSHQEKWDGSGYPQGLRGDSIPLSARLMAVADVYDALISKRVYKPAMTHIDAIALMRDGRGTHFDPEILDSFIKIDQEVRAIAERFSDSDPAVAFHPISAPTENVMGATSNQWQKIA